MKVQFTNEELEKIAEKIAEKLAEKIPAIMEGRILFHSVRTDTLVRGMPCKTPAIRTKVLRIMRDNGYNNPTLADVAKYSKSYYLRCHCMGSKSVDELSLILANAGLSFGELDPSVRI